MNVTLIKCLLRIMASILDITAMVCLAVRLMSDDLIHSLRQLMYDSNNDAREIAVVEFCLDPPKHTYDDRSMRQRLRANGGTAYIS